MNHTLRGFAHFFNDALLHQQLRALVVAACALGLVVILWRVWHAWRTHQARSNGTIAILLWLFVPFVIFHAFTGELFPHYFSLIFPVPFLIVAIAADWLWQQRSLRFAVVPLVGTFAVLATFQTVTALHALRPDGPRTPEVPLTLQDLQLASAFIIQDAHGKPFQLTVLPSAYSQSFQYLLDQAGVSPVQSAALHYTFLRGQAPDLTPYFKQPQTNIQTFANYAIVEQIAE